MLLYNVGVVVQCLIEFQLLHLFSILDFLVLWDAVLVQLLIEIVIVSKLASLIFLTIIGFHLISTESFRSSTHLLSARFFQRRPLHERLHLRKSRA